MHAKKRSIFELYIKEGDRKSPVLNRISDKYSSHTGNPPRYVDKQFFGDLFGDKLHQGVAIDVSPLEPEYMEALPKYPTTTTSTSTSSSTSSAPVPLWVALDEIQDPQNFGSVLRSCSFFGVSGVVIPGKRTAPLSPTVSKASSGAMELIDIFEAINLRSFIQRSKENGWCIIGTSSEGQEVDISSLQLNKPSVIIFGNEAKGISSNLLSLCDVVVKIPTSTPNPQILDSLNVGVATGIFLYELHKKRRMGGEL
uniref:tRNA/rRNA methyltransferase SpoU type domain-containing protein n=1 Tax=Arcella intermedia TaxID=1963864 RepID=A0A6B2LCJ6_9EUKA